MRVVDLDMTDSNQSCPDGFRLVSRTAPPLRTCGRPGPAGCESTTFPTHGIEYSRVCGRVIAYQDRTPDGFFPYATGRVTDIDDHYVAGVSLTHGQSPRQHIWTFAATPDELQAYSDSNGNASTFSCPCIRPDRVFDAELPPFVGQDYFCDSGNPNYGLRFDFFPDDPLWDGEGCGYVSTCCEFNNPPWFCKQLPQPTTDDIELRLCEDQGINDEDTPIEMVEIYVN